MKKIFILSCFIAFAFFVLFPRSFIYAAEVTDNYETAIDKVADAYIGKSVPGACVVVSEHGEIVFSKAYGYADLEKNVPMNPKNTVFEWGSISKTFIWVSVMQLSEEGKIDLNADIRNYLPKGFLKNLRYDTPVTMHHFNSTKAEEMYAAAYVSIYLWSYAWNFWNYWNGSLVFNKGTEHHRLV